MSILLIGGHDRMHREYKAVCGTMNCRVKIFTQMPARFNKVIGNPDKIILFTSTVSHQMVKVAVAEAKRKQIPLVRSHSSSASALKEILQG